VDTYGLSLASSKMVVLGHANLPTYIRLNLRNVYSNKWSRAADFSRRDVW
jgi:hypothetical protein